MECELSRLSWNSWMLYKRITWWNVGIFYSFWEVLNGIEDGFLKNIWRRKRKTLPRLSFFSLSTTRTTPDQAGGAGGRQTIRTLGIHGRNDKAHEVVARKAQYQPWPEPSSSAATEKKNTSCILPWKPQDFWCWLLYFVSSVLIIYESFLMLYYIYIFRVFLCVFFFEIKKNGKMIDSYFSLRPNVTVSCVVCGDLPRHSVRPPCLSLNILCLFHHCLQAFYFSDHLVSSLLLLYLFFIVSSPPKPGYLVLLIGFLFFFMY